jgi:hypothetical protein
VIQQRPRRVRSSAHGAKPASDPEAPEGGWLWRLALALLALAAVSAFGNLISLVVVGATVGGSDSPQGPETYIPVFVGAVVGLVGDGLLLRGALGVIRPTIPYSGKRRLVIVGLVLQLPAAAAVGTLEASWAMTVVYVLIVAGVVVWWSRLTPGLGPRPLAQHPAGSPRRVDVASTGRWVVNEPIQPIRWVGGAPPPPSAPAANSALGRESEGMGNQGQPTGQRR